MKKQPGATLSRAINGSRSCYKTTKRFAFLSVGTILARTTDISSDILNWFWSLFKDVKTLTKGHGKGICFIFKENFAHLTQRRALRALIIASAKRLKSLFVQSKFTQTLCIWTIHIPNENNSTNVIHKIRGECAAHCNCSQKYHTCRQQKINSCRDVSFHGKQGWQHL